MTQRSIPTAARKDAQQPESAHARIWFIVVRHPNLLEPIRVASDVLDYTLDGHLYKGIPITVIPITDTDQQASSKIRMPNIDRQIGDALRTISGRAMFEATQYSTADFDLTKQPREAIGTPSPILSYEQFELRNVDVDAIAVSGDLTLTDFAQEPVPHHRATADRTPGVWR